MDNAGWIRPLGQLQSSLTPICKATMCRQRLGSCLWNRPIHLMLVRPNSVPYKGMSYADPAAVPAGLTASAGGRGLACPPGAAPSPCQTPATPTVASPPVHLPHLSLRLPAERQCSILSRRKSFAFIAWCSMSCEIHASSIVLLFARLGAQEKSAFQEKMSLQARRLPLLLQQYQHNSMAGSFPHGQRQAKH